MSLLDELGIDPDDFTWQKLSTCQGAETNLFFDKYEEDEVVREQIDAMCSVCPVRRECLISGLQEKEFGVWGGVYLDGYGRPDKNKNSHKPEGWREEIAELLS